MLFLRFTARASRDAVVAVISVDEVAVIKYSKQ